MNLKEYTPVKRTVIFGGHDSFLKVLKKRVPTAKYVDPSNLKFSPYIIKNADIIWIQNNCICHPQYWNIIKYAKHYKTKFMHFNYASVDKCVQQLIAEDGT